MKNPLDIDKDGDVDRADAKAAAERTSAAVRKTVQETTHAVGEMSPAEKKATAWLAAIGVLIGVALAITLIVLYAQS